MARRLTAAASVATGPPKRCACWLWNGASQPNPASCIEAGMRPRPGERAAARASRGVSSRRRSYIQSPIGITKSTPVTRGLRPAQRAPRPAPSAPDGPRRGRHVQRQEQRLRVHRRKEERNGRKGEQQHGCVGCRTPQLEFRQAVQDPHGHGETDGADHNPGCHIGSERPPDRGRGDRIGGEEDRRRRLVAVCAMLRYPSASQRSTGATSRLPTAPKLRVIPVGST